MTMTNDSNNSSSSSSILVITTSSQTSVIDKAPVGVVGDNDKNRISALAAVASTQEQFNRAASLDQEIPANKYHHDKEEEQELEFAEFVALMKFSSFHDQDDDDEDDANKTRNNQVTMEDLNDGLVIRPIPCRVRAEGGKQMANCNVEENHVNYHSTPPPPQAAFAATGGHTIPSFPGKETENGGGEGNHYVRKTPSGQEEKTSIMLMTMMNSNAKFSPIVWRTPNTDLRGPPAGTRYRGSIFPPLAPVGAVATGTSLFEAIHDTTAATTTTANIHPSKAERDEEIVVVQDQPPTSKNLPPIPSPPSTRLTSKQSAGPPKIPTLKKKGDDETLTSITGSALLFHNNNINQGNENKEDDDDEVAGITSCTKRTSDNHAVVKSPSLAPRKRSLDCHHDDTPTPQSCTEGSSSICGEITGRPIFFDVSLLPTSRKYWIPPRRPTKRSRLFLIDHPHDEDDQEQEVNDQGKGVGDQDEIMDNDHVHDHPEEGSVATFSLSSSSSSSSSSSGLSIATPHSCPSPTTFSIRSSSADISSAVATSTIATPAAATYSLDVQFVIVPKFANDIVASEEKSEGAPTNLFFTPPRSEV